MRGALCARRQSRRPQSSNQASTTTCLSSPHLQKGGMMNPVDLMARYAPRNVAGEPGICPGYKMVADPLPHARFRTAMYRISDLHQRRRTHGMGGGLLISGPS